MGQTRNINSMDYIGSYISSLRRVDKRIRHLFINLPFLEPKNFQIYLEKIQAEFMQNIAWGLEFKNVETLYISSRIFTLESLEQCLIFIKNILFLVDLVTDCEITLELPSADFPANYLSQLREARVNRIVLDFDEFLHCDESSMSKGSNLSDVCHRLQKSGFENISIDYRYNKPNQNTIVLHEDMDLIIDSGIKHIYIEDSQAEEDVQAMQINNERKQYHFIREYLQRHNFMHYELLAFASSKDFFSRNNLSYWNGEDYLGLGVGATSKISKLRFKNNLNITEYLSSAVNKISYSVEDILSKDDLAFDYFVLAINKLSGFNKKDFEKYTGETLSTKYTDILEDLESKGLLEMHHDSWILTYMGLDNINSILLYFIC